MWFPLVLSLLVWLLAGQTSPVLASTCTFNLATSGSINTTHYGSSSVFFASPLYVSGWSQGSAHFPQQNSKPVCIADGTGCRRMLRNPKRTLAGELEETQVAYPRSLLGFLLCSVVSYIVLAHFRSTTQAAPIATRCFLLPLVHHRWQLSSSSDVAADRANALVSNSYFLLTLRRRRTA